MRDGQVRVVTWNIWWRFGPRWDDRQPGLLETLRRLDPDVVALQEVWGSERTTQAHRLAEALGLHAVFAEPSYPPAPEPDAGADDESLTLGIALLSRWPVGEPRVVAMPSRHRAWDPVTFTATVAHPVGPLHVVCACLEYGIPYTDDRIAQARLLAELATDPELDGPCPVLVMGDLNAAPQSAVLRPLHDLLVDAWAAGGGDPDAVTLPSTHPSAPLGAGPELVDRRIDHVFFRAGAEDQQVVVDSVALAGDAVGGVFPSDHRAVVCDLRWRAPDPVSEG